ncbi:CD44 antigen isoform X1 [Ochotona curzoniae]|uniref:CD44 antigen isoform X1 n=1 Tax=Ochotona curzoniae TaxID=130825 RepID=UPI001B345935|nr:CD44 antigen isoform X1 [Ochotona curzoniae]
MDKFWWRTAWGLCLVQLSLAQMHIDLNITCRFAGVFHVEKNGRYSISRTEAEDLCKAFNSSLPTMAQMEQALEKGFETCRYGFIQGHVVIPRINPNSICAANHTGVYILQSNTSQYDTYCFNASAPDGEDCSSVTDLPNSFDGPVTINIVNRDGTRYTKKGEYRTNPDDINRGNLSNNSSDEDVSSGFSVERNTPDATIFPTHLPTAHSTAESDTEYPLDHIPTTITPTVHSSSHATTQEQNNWIWSWFGNSQPTTQDSSTTATAALMNTNGTASEATTKRPETHDWLSWLFQPSESKNHLHTTTQMAGTDSNTNSAVWELEEENEDEGIKHFSFSGSGIDDEEDFISSTTSTTPWISDQTKQNQDWTQRIPSHSNPELLLQTTTRMTDVDRNGINAQQKNWTQAPQPPLIDHGHHDEEDTQHSTSTSKNNTTEETATQKEQWFGNEWHGGFPQTTGEDSHSTEGITASAHNSHPSQTVTTQNQEDSSWTDFFDPISHPMGRGHPTETKIDTETSPSTMPQPTPDPSTGSVEDVERTGPLTVTTQQSPFQNLSTSHGGLEEDKDLTTISTLTSGNRTDGTGGRRGGHFSADSTTSSEGYIPHYADTQENRTLMPVTPANTGAFGMTEVTVVGDSNLDLDRFLPGDQDSSVDPNRKYHTTHGSESAGHSNGSPDGGISTTSGPIRKPQIPEWLIILASLLALALILAVCIAVNSRRRCGQKKKLVINNGNGTVEDRKPSGLNGEASKSQEMVHLVNKESSETPDQFMTTDETQNLQNVNMKVEM